MVVYLFCFPEKAKLRPGGGFKLLPGPYIPLHGGPPPCAGHPLLVRGGGLASVREPLRGSAGTSGGGGSGGVRGGQPGVRVSLPTAAGRDAGRLGRGRALSASAARHALEWPRGRDARGRGTRRRVEKPGRHATSVSLSP